MNLDQILLAQPGLDSKNQQPPFPNALAGPGQAVAVPPIAALSSPGMPGVVPQVNTPDDPELSKKKRQKALYNSIIAKQNEIGLQMNDFRRIYQSNGKKFEDSDEHKKLYKEWSELNGMLNTLPKDVATYPDPETDLSVK